MWRARVSRSGVVITSILTACERPPNVERAQQSVDSKIAVSRQEPARAPDAGKELVSPPAPEQLSWRVEDVGIFSELDAQIVWREPSWLTDEATITLCPKGKEDAPCYAYIDGVVVGLATRRGEDPVVEVESWGEMDTDSDGIPDQIDVLRGALKAELNNARYLGGYEQLDYPGGDVSRDKGVCTDVIVRAVRNAGVDLQVELFEDIARSPRSFPMVERANPHIDQRRVKTLLPYFERQWRELPAEPAIIDSPYLPGDVLFMQTMGDARPDHVGIVSDRLADSGLPLVINNWTDGFATSAMDILDIAPVTHRFRLDRDPPIVSPSHRGLPGVLKRQVIDLPDEVMRVVLVTASFWTASRGTLRRYEKREGAWNEVGEPVEVKLGSRGLAVGKGAEMPMSAWALRAEQKLEGDRKTPTGVFKLGLAFGPSKIAPKKSTWPWHKVEAGDVWVDDAKDRAYNRMMASDAPVTWSSAEDLRIYELGLVIEHNTDPVTPGKGSAIFMHTWDERERSTTLGCTSMAKRDLEALVGWLDPEQPTRLVQVVDSVF